MKMYESRLGKDGAVTPSHRAKYDPARIAEQGRCPHRFGDLHWGGNAKSRYASCNKCGLKSVILYRKREEESEDDEPENEVKETFMEASQTYLVEVPMGAIMADTGCQTPVAGPRWHQQFQSVMKAMGREFHAERCSEFFQFGPGDPIEATTKWVYQVGVLGKTWPFAIAEVDAGEERQVPGLVGKHHLKKWGVVIDFPEDVYRVGEKQKKLIYTSTGHPCIDLTDFAPHFRFPWRSTRARART